MLLVRDRGRGARTRLFHYVGHFAPRFVAGRHLFARLHAPVVQHGPPLDLSDQLFLHDGVVVAGPPPPPLPPLSLSRYGYVYRVTARIFPVPRRPSAVLRVQRARPNDARATCAGFHYCGAPRRWRRRRRRRQRRRRQRRQRRPATEATRRRRRWFASAAVRLRGTASCRGVGRLRMRAEPSRNCRSPPFPPRARTASIVRIRTPRTCARGFVRVCCSRPR